MVSSSLSETNNIGGVFLFFFALGAEVLAEAVRFLFFTAATFLAGADVSPAFSNSSTSSNQNGFCDQPGLKHKNKLLTKYI